MINELSNAEIAPHHGGTAKNPSVLIVGGGPVGLALAIELGLRRVSCVVIEQRDGTVQVPKMNNINTRTMEFCRRWQIADKIREAGLAKDHPLDVRWVTSITGHELLRFELPSFVERGKLSYTPEGNSVCSQLWFDPILLERARSLPSVSLRHRTRLESFVQDEAGVCAEVMDISSGKKETITAAFLVGCDGGESYVGALAGIKSEGLPRVNTNMNVFFRCPRLLSLQQGRRMQMQRLIGPEGVWGNFLAVDGKELWRLTIFLPSGADSDPESFDVAGHIRKAIGRDIDFDVLRVFSWVRRHVVAEHYRRGSIFLAGDAAHQMSTTGAFGMNTGIGDAVDLAWKLGGAIGGWAGVSLLDSYELERKPIAVRNIDEAGRNYLNESALRPKKEILEDSSAGEVARREFAMALIGSGARSQVENEGIALGYRYDASPIICPDDTPLPPDEVETYTQTARPGSRAPHAWISKEKSTLDLFGDGFTLLQTGTSPVGADSLVEASAKRQMPLKVVSIEDPAIARLYERRLTLVRPDGYVAWRSDNAPQDAMAIIDRVRGLPLGNG
jgi:2-polyprenyl-6-methoxyphenol hydroxylase-like FAD-dependent oxidoreductase